MLPHLYPNTPESLAIANGDDWDDDQYARAQEHIEAFYEEIFSELQKYGEIEDLIVLESVSDHLKGNVYCKFYEESACESAVKGLTNCFYGGSLVQPEATQIVDFRRARIKHIPRAVKRRLVREMYDEHPEYKGPGGRSDHTRSPRKKKENEKKRQSTPERRATIAGWNKERKAELEARAATAVAAGGAVVAAATAAPTPVATTTPAPAPAPTPTVTDTATSTSSQPAPPPLVPPPLLAPPGPPPMLAPGMLTPTLPSPRPPV